MINGFACMRLQKSKLCFAPRLSEQWVRYRFCLLFRGATLQVSVERAGVQFLLLDGGPVRFCVFGHEVTLEQVGGKVILKSYRAAFFNWDGTAVLSRRVPVKEAVEAIALLLDAVVKLAIISGTSYENIAGGQLHTYFTARQLQNLYLGLGRGAFNYDSPCGEPVIFEERLPDREPLGAIHRVAFDIHPYVAAGGLRPEYGPFNWHNYCKFDLASEICVISRKWRWRRGGPTVWPSAPPATVSIWK